MSIETELQERIGRLATAFSSANTAITGKGGTAAADISGLADAIATIRSGGGVDVAPLSVTANGTYTAQTGKAYSPVTVNVQGGGNPNVFVYHSVSNAQTIEITHSLGLTPTHAACMCLDTDTQSDNTSKLISSFTALNGASGRTQYIATDGVMTTGTNALTINEATATTLTLYNVRPFHGGSDYIFIFA